MRGARDLPLALTTTAAVIFAIGWYMSSHAGVERDFNSCRRSDGRMTLTYDHGPGDEIALSSVPRGNGDETLSYRVNAPEGPQPAILVISTVTLDAPSGKVFHPDGREITCEEVVPGEAEFGRP